MNIPDCTLTTCCFNIENINSKGKTGDQLLELTKPLLETPCYLVIYTDKTMINKLRKIRDNAVSQKLTKFIVMDINSLEAFKYKNQVIENRKKYHPTKDERTDESSHLICSSKFNLVLKTIELNPFNTSKYGWIDCCVGENFGRICTNYKNNMLCQILHETCNQKFHIQVINATDKKYINEEHLHEYYSKYRWLITGGFFITGKEIGKTILTELHNTFKRHTELGYGHGEEMYYLGVLDKYYDNIHRSYGDYKYTLNNFLNVNIGIEYIYHHIIKNYQSLNYNRECVECCEHLIQRFENYDIEMNNKYYFLILVCYYVSMYYININKAKEIVLKIYDLIENNTEISNEYHLNRKYYNDQFVFVAPKQTKIIFLILANDTDHYLPMQVEWRKYMQSHPHIKSYFIKYQNDNETEIYLQDDTIYMRGDESLIPGCLDKTIKSIELLLNENTEFDYILRTNMSSIWNLNKFYDLIHNNGYQAAAVNGIAGGKTFLSGAGMLLSKNICKLLINNKDEIDYNIIDDLAISYFLLDKNIKFDKLKKLDAYASLTEEDINNAVIEHYHFRSKDWSIHPNNYIDYMRIFVNKIYGL